MGQLLYLTPVMAIVGISIYIIAFGETVACLFAEERGI
jgi:hypothetical protein